MKGPETMQWGTYSLGEDERTRMLRGSLLLEGTRCEQEICLAARSLSATELAELTEESTPKWTRWAVCTGSSEIELQPGLPALSLLVQPETPFHVLPGAEARIFVRIPLSVVVRVKDHFDQLLAEFPTENLSQTWFGSTDGGELCFALSSPAEKCPLESDEGGIQAPIRIRNESKEMLAVERICLRVDGLSIYESGGSLWTNETVVGFQGGVDVSSVKVVTGPPREASAAHLVARPRTKGPVNAMGRTFRTLKKWTVDLLDVG